ncbi:beta-glucosidase-domain-containing protein [Nemania diffusa]|nr:beta-glucosidase-domain-containing protein [Nemania diffusa]
MKTTTLQAAIGSAILLLATQPCYASSGHQHHHQHRQLHELHHQHHQHHASKRESFSPSNATVNPLYESRRSGKLQARGGAKCEFPTTKGLFAVTPDSLNGGWALAPDQDCVDGTWCPIACPAGQVMAQWKPGTTYTYPESTYGGIYCDNGKIDVPFEDKPWCVDGTGTVDAVNKAGSVVSFCQTVLPGYEDMIIPTDVYDSATLAVPDSSYWDSTASHFYINAPGVSSDEGCHWGDDSKPIGNWAPFVAGANTDGSGNTFVKLGLNPVWQDSALYSTKPTFGLKIECDGDCNGLPCEMDGNGVISNEKATGAGGADFCVVTVPKGGKANIIVYNLDGSDGGDSGDDDSDATTSSAEATSTPTSTSTPTPTTTSTPTSTSISTTSAPSTTSTPISTSTSASTSSSSNVQTTISASRSSVISSYPVPSSSTTTSHFLGAVYHQNDTASATDSSSNPATTSVPAGSTSESASGSGSGSESESSPAESSHSENAGKRQDGAAVAGLIIAFVAAVYLL